MPVRGRAMLSGITCMPGVKLPGARVRCVFLCVPVDVDVRVRHCYAIWHHMHTWGGPSGGTGALCVLVRACRCGRPCWTLLCYLTSHAYLGWTLWGYRCVVLVQACGCGRLC